MIRLWLNTFWKAALGISAFLFLIYVPATLVNSGRYGVAAVLFIFGLAALISFLEVHIERG